MVQIRLGLITSYDDVWTLYPRNVKTHYRSIMYHLELAAEQRIRLSDIQRSIGFRRLSILWPGKEGLRLSVLQRLTQFWNIILSRDSHQKDFSDLLFWSISSNLGKSALLTTIAQIAYSYKHCTTDNGWQDEFGYTSDRHLMHHVNLVDGLSMGRTLISIL